MDIVVFASSSAPHCVLIKWHGIAPSDDVLKSALAIMSPEIVLRNAYTLEDIVPTSSFIGPRNFTMSTNEIVNLASFDHEMETPILVDLADEQGVTAINSKTFLQTSTDEELLQTHASGYFMFYFTEMHSILLHIIKYAIFIPRSGVLVQRT